MARGRERERDMSPSSSQRDSINGAARFPMPSKKNKRAQEIEPTGTTTTTSIITINIIWSPPSTTNLPHSPSESFKEISFENLIPEKKKISH